MCDELESISKETAGTHSKSTLEGSRIRMKDIRIADVPGDSKQAPLEYKPSVTYTPAFSVTVITITSFCP
jgi:hypothetical protein